ncbi:MAG TPA: glutaredoxin domain-containing protein [Candidatus Nanoarchaeia archaeon]|nr:glutaredoxin domain-containing protein [Candidatus Nanoarchaeia archaeon]
MKTLKVKIYTTPTCHLCHDSKEFFKEHGVKFKELDVMSNKKNADEMIKKSKQYGTPVIDINGKIIVGFNEEALRKELKIK